MARVVIDQTGCNALADHVLRRAEAAALAQGVDAERFAPVLTGALRLSVHVTEVGRGHWRISAGTGLPDGRAVYNELGTSKMAAQPYIRPAMYQARVF
jgi:hypothetical protein